MTWDCSVTAWMCEDDVIFHIAACILIITTAGWGIKNYSGDTCRTILCIPVVFISMHGYLLTMRSGLSVILVKVVLILFNTRFNAGWTSSGDQSMFGNASSMNLKRNVTEITQYGNIVTKIHYFFSERSVRHGNWLYILSH